MRLQLRVGSGARIGEVLTITQEGGVLGRSPSHPALHLPDEGVSGRHLRFRCDGRRFLVSDLGSTNGTVLDGVLLPRDQEVPLPTRGKLKLGNVHMEFWSEEPVAIPDTVAQPLLPPGAAGRSPPVVDYRPPPPVQQIPATMVAPPRRSETVTGVADSAQRGGAPFMDGGAVRRPPPPPPPRDDLQVRFDALRAEHARLGEENTALRQQIQEQQRALASLKTAPAPATAGDVAFHLREAQDHLAAFADALLAIGRALERGDSAAAREQLRKAAAHKAEMHFLLQAYLDR